GEHVVAGANDELRGFLLCELEDAAEDCRRISAGGGLRGRAAVAEHGKLHQAASTAATTASALSASAPASDSAVAAPGASASSAAAAAVTGVCHVGRARAVAAVAAAGCTRRARRYEECRRESCLLHTRSCAALLRAFLTSS